MFGDNNKRKWKKPAGYAGIAIISLFVLLFTFIGSAYHIHIAIIIMLYAISASSLRTIYLSGQLSVGHAGFMGVGAYTSAIMAQQLGWTPWVTIPLAALATLAIAIIVAFPFSRIRAIYFAMVTLFFGVGVQAVLTGFPEVTGGSSGLTGIPPLKSFTIPGGFEANFAGSPLPYYYLVLVITVLSLIVLYRIEHSRIGMTLRGIAQSPPVALSVGINEAGYRILAFAIGGFFAGIAGACLAHYSMVLSPASFGVMTSIMLLAYLLVGGVGNFAGPVIGTVFLILIPEVFSGLKQFSPFVVAVAMLVVIFRMPRGLAGLPEQVTSWFRARGERRASRNAS